MFVPNTSKLSTFSNFVVFILNVARFMMDYGILFLSINEPKIDFQNLPSLISRTQEVT